jgi:protein involved in polysaccharide export with SLBB domain
LGLTTDEFKKLVEDGLKPSFTDGVPAVQIAVKEINSRKVCISGAVNKQGCYPLIGPMNVNQTHCDRGWARRVRKQEEDSARPRLAQRTERPAGHALHQLRRLHERQERFSGTIPT